MFFMVTVEREREKEGRKKIKNKMNINIKHETKKETPKCGEFESFALCFASFKIPSPPFPCPVFAFHTAYALIVLFPLLLFQSFFFFLNKCFQS